MTSIPPGLCWLPVTQPRALPVVGFGIGRSGVTFSLLGPSLCITVDLRGSRKGNGSLRTAAHRLAAEGRVSLCGYQLEDPILGILGYGLAENTAARVLNAAFQQMDKPIRCLPLIPGDFSRLPKMLATMKINGLIVDPALMNDVRALAAPGDELSERTGCQDLLMERKDGWKGIGTLMQAVDLQGNRSRTPLTGRLADRCWCWVTLPLPGPPQSTSPRRAPRSAWHPRPTTPPRELREKPEFGW